VPRQRQTKGEPFSVRFSGATDLAVTDEARRSRRSKSAVVEALAEEAMRTRRFPGIAFRGEDALRRPWVIGTGLDVWEICQLAEELDPAELLADMRLTEHQVRLALAYRERYPDEISEAISENRRPLEEWRELYPFVRTPGASG
jgi:uncharacterized protein (DUF433 family)